MPILMFLGVALVVVGGIGTLIAAFRTSLVWGLACFLFAPASLAFLILHWDVARNPFLLQLAGTGLVFVEAFS